MWFREWLLSHFPVLKTYSGSVKLRSTILSNHFRDVRYILIFFILFYTIKTLYTWGRYLYYMLILPGPNLIKSQLLGIGILIRSRTEQKTVAAVTLDVLTNDPDLEVYKRTGILRFWCGTKFSVLLTRPETTALLLSSSEFLDKSSVYEKGYDFLGDGIFNSTGLRWKAHRKLMNPAFHGKFFIQSYIPAMVTNAKKLVLRMNRLKNSDGAIYGVHKPAAHYALKVVLESVLGVVTSEEMDEEILDHQEHVMEIVFERLSNVRYMSDLIFYRTELGKSYLRKIGKLHMYAANFIAQRRNILARNDNNPQTFIDILIQENLRDPSRVTQHMMLEEVMSIFAAGHDTTTWGLVWTLLLLGHHPDIQEMILNEIEEYVSFHDTITLEVLNRLKFLEAVVLESLRLYPTAAGFSRSPPNDLIVTCDEKTYTIPAGSDVFIVQDMIHRSEAVWPDANTFDPYRFYQDDRTRHPNAYLSFAAGPRSCIGKKFAMNQLKVALIFLVKNFEMKSLVAMEQVKLDPVIFLRSATSIDIKFSVRI